MRKGLCLCLIGLLAPLAAFAQEPGGEPGEALAPFEEGLVEEPMVLDTGERVYLQAKVIVLDGVVAIRGGLIELFACGRGGKEHEAVAVCQCTPQNIHLALILFGLKEGEGVQWFGDPSLPKGERLVVELEWDRPSGEGVERHPAESCIWNVSRSAPMLRVGWVFVGSRFYDELDPDTGRPTGRQLYMANIEKSLVTTYHDPSSILDNPMFSGGDDTLYVANERVLPEQLTAVRMIIRLPTSDERREMNRKLENALHQWKRRRPEEGEGGEGE